MSNRLLRNLLVMGAAAAGGLLPRPAAAAVSFTREVAPILVKRCTGCHGERVNLGGYRAHTFQGLLRAGASGKPAIVPGKPEASRLYQLITAASEAARMPKKDDPLSPAQVSLVRRWIQEGARFDGGSPTTDLNTLLGPRRHPAAPVVYRTPVPVTALAFAPGGQELFVAGYHEITVWNPASGALIRRLPHLPQRVQSISFSPDGKRLLVAGGTPGEYGEVALVDPQSGARVTVLDTFPDIALAAAFSRDGKWAAAGGADATARLYEVATGKRVWNNRVHSDWVTGVGFSADGRFVASSSRDLTVKVYEAGSGALFTTYNGHNKNYGKYRGQFPVFALRFAPEGPLALSAGAGPTIQVWDPVKASQENGTAADMEERFSKESHARHIEHGFKQEVYNLVARDGQVFAASGDGTVKQFDLAGLKEVRTFGGFSDWVFGLDYDPASRQIAAGAYNGEVKVWDTGTGKLTLTFRAQPGSGAAPGPRKAANRPLPTRP